MMSYKDRVDGFCKRFGVQRPILLAPMAGVSAPELSVAVMKAGGLGACGALLMSPKEIVEWADHVRGAGGGAFQINLWTPDPTPQRDERYEANIRAFLAAWGPNVPPDAGSEALPDYEQQCEALIEAGSTIASSVMGLFPPHYVHRLKRKGLAWFATVSTVSEAIAAEEAGADVIVAQGMEAGGHRAAFAGDRAERELVGLFSLLPCVADAVRLPVIATGGIADGRGIAAALALGASAVQIGTAFLRCPEAGISPAWAKALAHVRPEETIVSRVFSGRPARSIATAYVKAATSPQAPAPASYPVQRGLTAPMRKAANAAGNIDGMQAWAGQSAGLARAMPAGELLRRVWDDAQDLLQ